MRSMASCRISLLGRFASAAFHCRGCRLLLTGAFIIWQSRAQAPALPPAPPGANCDALDGDRAGAARGARSDAEEPRGTALLARRPGQERPDRGGGAAPPTPKAFAKLDGNGNGTLSFEKWAVKSIGKFRDADRDRSGWLTPAEYATTAPQPPKKKRCAC